MAAAPAAPQPQPPRSHQWPGGQPADTLEQLLAGPPGADASGGLLGYLPLLAGRRPAELTDAVLAEAGVGKVFHRRRICKWVGSLVEAQAPEPEPAVGQGGPDSPDPEEAGWTVRELKRAIERSGGSWAGLAEKAELVARAVELRAGRPSVRGFEASVAACRAQCAAHPRRPGDDRVRPPCTHGDEQAVFWATAAPPWRCDLCKAPYSGEPAVVGRFEAAQRAARAEDEAACGGRIEFGAAGGAAAFPRVVPAAAAAAHARRLHGFAVPVWWLQEFVQAHDCWEWPTWRVQQDVVRPVCFGRGRCRYAELAEVAGLCGPADVFASHCWCVGSRALSLSNRPATTVYSAVVRSNAELSLSVLVAAVFVAVAGARRSGCWWRRCARGRRPGGWCGSTCSRCGSSRGTRPTWCAVPLA